MNDFVNGWKGRVVLAIICFLLFVRALIDSELAHGPKGFLSFIFATATVLSIAYAIKLYNKQ